MRQPSKEDATKPFAFSWRSHDIMKLILTPEQIDCGCAARSFSPALREELQKAIDAKDLFSTAMTETPKGVLLCIMPGLLVRTRRGAGGGHLLSFTPVFSPVGMECFEVRDSKTGQLNMAVLNGSVEQVSVNDKGFAPSKHSLHGPGCDPAIIEPAELALNRLLLRERHDPVVKQIFAYLVSLAKGAVVP